MIAITDYQEYVRLCIINKVNYIKKIYNKLDFVSKQNRLKKDVYDFTKNIYNYKIYVGVWEIFFTSLDN